MNSHELFRPVEHLKGVALRSVPMLDNALARALKIRSALTRLRYVPSSGPVPIELHMRSQQIFQSSHHVLYYFGCTD
jgi:hypothetical protein